MSEINTMTHRRRLARLESEVGITGPCPACGYSASIVLLPVVQFNLHTAPGPAPDPTPCATCGRVPERFTLRLNPIELDGGREL